MSSAATIKQLALDHGFSSVGIARAEPLDSEREALNAWLGEGFHGSMEWLARAPEKRIDPRSVYADARSAVVVAMNYFTPHTHAEAPESGKVSRYAWGDDYHEIMRERMNALLTRIKEELPGSDGRACVDTAPLLEKAWAVRAGLGWIGKHSNLITRTHGSWVFLGVILLNIELTPDAPYPDDHCGSCTACIDACPTDAIVNPSVVDSRRCISYTTIELRDEALPAETTETLNGWIYGCDICQDVCPWNRFEQPTDEPRFEPRRGETSLELLQVANMQHEEYVERFRRSAMKRAKLKGLKRNAAALLSAGKN